MPQALGWIAAVLSIRGLMVMVVTIENMVVIDSCAMATPAPISFSWMGEATEVSLKTQTPLNQRATAERWNTTADSDSACQPSCKSHSRWKITSCLKKF
jgi:hypothetical protein